MILMVMIVTVVKHKIVTDKVMSVTLFQSLSSSAEEGKKEKQFISSVAQPKEKNREQILSHLN